MEHAKLPWAVRGCRIYGGVGSPEEESVDIMLHPVLSGLEQEAANADFLVHAVNIHSRVMRCLNSALTVAEELSDGTYSLRITTEDLAEMRDIVTVMRSEG